MNKQGLYQNENTDVKENVVAGIVGLCGFLQEGSPPQRWRHNVTLCGFLYQLILSKNFLYPILPR